jgi:aconitate hydratase 2/2-methylisocitrate dehydratase
MIMLQRVARTGYENILYLERPGCNLYGVTRKARDTVWQLLLVFQGRVVEDSGRRIFTFSTPVVVLSTILGRLLLWKSIQ